MSIVVCFSFMFFCYINEKYVSTGRKLNQSARTREIVDKLVLWLNSRFRK